MDEVEVKRKTLELSQEEVAVKVGVTRQYYNSIVNKRKKPSVILAKKIGEILKIDWTIFFA